MLVLSLSILEQSAPEMREILPLHLDISHPHFAVLLRCRTQSEDQQVRGNSDIF